MGSEEIKGELLRAVGEATGELLHLCSGPARRKHVEHLLLGHVIEEAIGSEHHHVAALHGHAHLGLGVEVGVGVGVGLE